MGPSVAPSDRHVSRNDRFSVNRFTLGVHRSFPPQTFGDKRNASTRLGRQRVSALDKSCSGPCRHNRNPPLAPPMWAEPSLDELIQIGIGLCTSTSCCTLKGMAPRPQRLRFDSRPRSSGRLLVPIHSNSCAALSSHSGLSMPTSPLGLMRTHNSLDIDLPPASVACVAMKTKQPVGTPHSETGSRGTGFSEAEVRLTQTPLRSVMMSPASGCI